PLRDTEPVVRGIRPRVPRGAGAIGLRHRLRPTRPGAVPISTVRATCLRSPDERQHQAPARHPYRAAPARWTLPAWRPPQAREFRPRARSTRSDQLAAHRLRRATAPDRETGTPRTSAQRVPRARSRAVRGTRVRKGPAGTCPARTKLECPRAAVQPRAM